MNQIIFYAKKAFKFWKAFQNKQNQSQKPQQNHSYNNNNQQSYNNNYNNQSPYPAVSNNNQQFQNNQSPYPATHQQTQGQHTSAWQGHQQQQQQQHPATGGYGGGGYGGHAGGGYGSHDGPATNQDMANAQTPFYVDLRNKAIQEGDLMGRAFDESKRAYSSGDGGRAKELSTEGHNHQRMKDQYNRQAAEWIYGENNKVQPNGTIDLHGLYVQESVDFTERAVQNARQQGLTTLRVIVGKGNHSASHVAKIKPAIEGLMRKENLSAELDARNSGVLIVHLTGQGGSRDIAGDMERSPDVCLVM